MTASSKKLKGIWFIVVPLILTCALLYGFGIFDSVFNRDKRLTPKTVMEVLDAGSDFNKISSIFQRKGFEVNKKKYPSAKGGTHWVYYIKKSFSSDKKTDIFSYDRYDYSLSLASDEDVILRIYVSDLASNDFEDALRDYDFTLIDSTQRDYRYLDGLYFLIDNQYVFILQRTDTTDDKIIAMRKNDIISVN